MSKNKGTLSWHFASADRKLRYGDGRLIEQGVVHKIEGKPILCSHGLHGSIRAIDALSYAQGSVVSRVIIRGDITKGENKLVGQEREYLWVVDAEETLREFSRWCALQVIHLWDAPAVVVRYLKTGDESIRAAAKDAAWAAAKAAVRDAAWDAAKVAAWDAARDAFNKKANRKLTTMLNKLYKESSDESV